MECRQGHGEVALVAAGKGNSLWAPARLPAPSREERDRPSRGPARPGARWPECLVTDDGVTRTRSPYNGILLGCRVSSECHVDESRKRDAEGKKPVPESRGIWSHVCDMPGPGMCGVTGLPLPQAPPHPAGASRVPGVRTWVLRGPWPAAHEP